MEVGENHEPPKFCIEVNVSRGGWKLAVLRLHQRVLKEVTVDLHCKIVCFNTIFCDMNIFSIVVAFLNEIH